MLESIIYHSVILVFIVCLLSYLFFLQKNVHILKVVIIAFFLEKEFLFPQNRSLFIRGIRTLEQLLSEKFGVKVLLEYDKSRKVFFSEEFKIFLDILFNEKKSVDITKLVSSQKNKKTRFISFIQLPNSSWELKIA